MKQISMRQASFLAFSIILAPAVRLFSSFILNMTDQTGWVGILPGGILLVGLVLLLNSMMKKYAGFPALSEAVFGKIGYKIVMAIYAIWGIALAAVYLRYCGERLCGTIFYNMKPWMFISLMTIILIYGLKGGLNTTARLNEIFAPLMAFFLVLIIVLLLGDCDIDNLLPLNRPISIANTAFCSFAIFSYVSIAAFFGGEIIDRKNFVKGMLWTHGILVVLSTFIFITLLGTLGDSVMDKLSYPFFAGVKQIKIGNFLQHIEAGVVSVWILSDYVIISVMANLGVRATNEVVGKDISQWWGPVLMVVCAILSLLPPNQFTLEKLSRFVFIPINVVVFVGIPVLMWIVGKCRRIL